MALGLEKALGIHPHALSLRMDRTQLLTSNLANVDTPGYQARDIDYATVLQQTARSLEQGGNGGPQAESLYRTPYQPSQDGNTVELSVEQTAFAENAMDFQTSLTFLNIKLRGLNQAIEGR
ncbi:flagellar basal body rod protein FlgB [Oceanisphaera sp. W20_SRM_FM3]|uniref:flagellar basal body rod protein FlgB n=1 Tax=Oceanisphaera sp. W20_SRM_FM3 TaxID=3240267 RepID=UPI003F9B4AB0